MLVADITANVVDMIRCISLKITSPLVHIKHKTGFERESIAMFNAALAVRLYFGSIELKWVSDE